MFPECSPNVPRMFPECSPNVPQTFHECYLAGAISESDKVAKVVKRVESIVDETVPWLFTECSLNVPWMFPECSTNVPWMFPECSPNIPWMLPGRRRIGKWQSRRSRQASRVRSRRCPRMYRLPAGFAPRYLDLAKMPWSVRTSRTLRCVKLFCCTGISMFIIIIQKAAVSEYQLDS
jgi:hypothetical protein